MNKVQSGGFCRKHGARTKVCSEEGCCTNGAGSGGGCRRHGVNLISAAEDKLE